MVFNSGVYSSEDIKRLIKDRKIVSKKSINMGNGKSDNGQIQPASLDLRLGRKAYQMRCSSIPDLEIEEYIEKYQDQEIDLSSGGFLHKGNIYMIELEEQLFLSHDIEAKSNPKSSIGRIDTHVRLLTGGGKFYDRIRSGYDKGKIFLEVIPHSFNILVKEGDCLNQVRFKDV